MKLKCPNKECGYIWNYGGDNKFYGTCPRCLRKVSVKYCKVEDIDLKPPKTTEKPNTTQNVSKEVL